VLAEPMASETFLRGSLWVVLTAAAGKALERRHRRVGWAEGKTGLSSFSKIGLIGGGDVDETCPVC